MNTLPRSMAEPWIWRLRRVAFGDRRAQRIALCAVLAALLLAGARPAFAAAELEAAPVEEAAPEAPAAN